MDDNGTVAAAWQARRLGIEQKPERSRELAAQAEHIGASVRRVAAAAAFEDEPAGFAAALQRAAEGARHG